MTHRILSWAALIALAGAPAGAEEQSAPPEEAPAAALGRIPDQPSLHGRLELSLGQAIEMGLENNLDVQIERFSPLIAGEGERIAWGAYDPEFSAQLDYSDAKTPTANALIGSGAPGQVFLNENESLGGSTALSGLVPWLGAQYTLGFEADRSTTNARFATVSPELTSKFSAQLTLPLLRDLIWNDAWTRVKTSALQYASSEEQFRTALMSTVQGIEDAYWNLVAAVERVNVERKSLETARALLEQTETQYEVGVVSRVEVVEAEAGVAEREFELILSENRYRNAQDVLIDLVLGSNLSADSTLEIAPSDRPEEYVRFEIDAEQAVAKAFTNRPELEVARKQIEEQEVQVEQAKSRRLPRLDAIVGYATEGLTGELNPNACTPFGGGPPDPACLSGFPAPAHFGDTFNEYGDARTWTAGARFSIPLPNTSARGTVSQRQLELRRAKTQLRRVEQDIVLEVRTAVRNLKSAQEGIQAAERRSAAAEEQLRAERIRLEYGESTPFDVLLRERDFVDAESQQIGAFQTYRTSATALDRAQGTILRTHKILLGEARRLR